MDAEPYTKAVAGNGATCLLRENNVVACWEPFQPHVAAGLVAAVGAAPSTAISISLSGGPNDIGCAVTQEHRVFCSNALPGTSTWAPIAPAVREIPGLVAPRLVEQVMTNSHACALGRCVQCWGENRLGQLGDGTSTPSDDPVFVKWPAWILL